MELIAFQKIQQTLQKKKSRLDVRRIFERKDVQEYIIQLNRYEQLWKEGVSPQGSVVGVYSIATEAITDSRPISASVFKFNGETKRKSAGEKFFFLDKGDFFSLFDVRIEDDGFIIISTSETAEKLKIKYGQLLGLTDENKTKLSLFIKKIILEEINK